MTIEKVNTLGMDLIRWTHESCRADFAVGKDWITLFFMESKEKNQKHAQELLTEAKDHYKDKEFGGSVALSPAMKHIYKKLNIKEYV